MKESYGEGLASHTGPESCAWHSCKAAREALTGARAGRVLSREMYRNQSADVVRIAEGNIGGCGNVSMHWTLRGLRPLHVWKLHAREPGGLTSARHRKGRAGWRRR
jgi:hypothetical protein